MRLSEVVRTTGFMDHAVAVTEVRDRRALLVERCRGRSVLHVGCADVPVFDPDTNLHLALARETDRLDGLDVSEEGIAALRRHVDGDYFTTPTAIDKEYDVVLAPEVIEHTRDPHGFLHGIFSVRARQYLVTAPHLAWFREMRLEAGVFHERVHPDHKAWYSPFTLLATVRPFIDAERDDVELFVLGEGASVAVAITKPFTPRPFAPRGPKPLGLDEALAIAAGDADGDFAGALGAIADARAAKDDARLFDAHARLLLRLGRNMEAVRQGLAWLRAHPTDARALLVCADAADALGEHERAKQWRAAARARR